MRHKHPNFSHSFVHRHPFASAPKFGEGSRGWQLVESWPDPGPCKEMQSRSKSRNRECKFLAIQKISHTQCLQHAFCMQSSPWLFLNSAVKSRRLFFSFLFPEHLGINAAYLSRSQTPSRRASLGNSWGSGEGFGAGVGRARLCPELYGGLHPSNCSSSNMGRMKQMFLCFNMYWWRLKSCCFEYQTLQRSPLSSVLIFTVVVFFIPSIFSQRRDLEECK